MQAWVQVACLASAVAFVAVTSARAGEPVGGDAGVREAFGRLAGKTVFFGHQSVGMNVLDGVRELATRSGTQVEIVEIREGTAVRPGSIAHAWVGKNHDPISKVGHFQRFVDGFPAPGVDIAFLKFCYVDFTAETDPVALLASYRVGVDALRRSHPRTVFVHVTAPLSTVHGGAKSMLKKALGKPPYGLVENVRREDFNQLLRQAYDGKEPLFDLARIESTAPDGRLETVEWKGRRVPSLVPGYTDDDGHLNEEGRRRVATALVSLLASLPDAPASGPAATR